jgi:molecular chaperone DnaJ
MTAKRDYYEVLGINRNASGPEIEQAYRRMAVQYHPDKVPPEKKEEAREKFKEISEAYAVLSDAQKRKQYDMYGHAGIDSRYTQEDIYRNVDFGSIFHDIGVSGGFESFFGDVFDFFGGAPQKAHRKGPERGVDIEVPALIRLSEAYKGAEKHIEYYHTETCPVCGGTGAKPGTSKKACPVCKGTGQQSTSYGGFLTFAQPCQKCRGTGEILENPCKECGGRGKVKKSTGITIKIPAGVDNGTSIRVRGQGEAGERSGPPGDLYVSVRIQPDSDFERVNDDIYTKVKVPFQTAALGGEIIVPTLDGSIRMKIPPGTQPDRDFRVKGKGMPNVHTSRSGDLYIKILIEVPTKLSERQKELLREFGRLSE